MAWNNALLTWCQNIVCCYFLQNRTSETISDSAECNLQLWKSSHKGLHLCCTLPVGIICWLWSVFGSQLGLFPYTIPYCGKICVNLCQSLFRAIKSAINPRENNILFLIISTEDSSIFCKASPIYYALSNLHCFSVAAIRSPLPSPFSQIFSVLTVLCTGFFTWIAGSVGNILR